MVWMLIAIFFLSVFFLFHTYILYPFLLSQQAKDARPNSIIYTNQEELPFVSAMVAIYNEEKVIAQKLMTLLSSNYPKEKLQIYVGSDCSSDRSNEIVSKMAEQYEQLNFYPFNHRSGKPGVLNQLSQIIFDHKAPSKDHIILLTDANVMLEKDTLYHLVKHFKNKKMAIVDANMIHTGMRSEGISKSEKQYIHNEVLLKNHEGLVKGVMIGPFGGCYTLRSNYFTKIPSNFLVDDFFIAMKTLQHDVLAINDLQAVCYEAVSHDPNEEYKRKSRISAGNFQNLNYFKSLLWPPFTTLGYRFLSHKVLRWLGPFFIIFALISSGVLAYMGNHFFKVLFYIQLVIVSGGPLLDRLFRLLNINILILRNISYFLYMNLALLEGFF